MVQRHSACATSRPGACRHGPQDSLAGHLEPAVLFRKECEAVDGSFGVPLGPAGETHEPAIARPLRELKVTYLVAAFVFALQAVDNRDLSLLHVHGAPPSPGPIPRPYRRAAETSWT